MMGQALEILNHDNSYIYEYPRILIYEDNHIIKLVLASPENFGPSYPHIYLSQVGVQLSFASLDFNSATMDLNGDHYFIKNKSHEIWDQCKLILS